MDKYLIINADDFGMCHAGNLAVFDLLQKGGITSSTIMAPCGWAKEAVCFAAEHPEFAIGVHLTTTSEWGKYRWAPVSSGPNDSLRDEEGFMYHESDEFEKGCDIEEVRAEIHAQIARLKGLGLNPSHLDNHMGSLYGIETGRIELLNLVLDIAAEYQLPFRFPSKFTDAQFTNAMLGIKLPKEIVTGMLSKFAAYGKSKGVAMPDYLIPGDWAGPQKDSYENYREYIFELYKTFEPGVTETYIHPALESEELKGITGNWMKRVWEYQLFSDPATLKYIDSLGIKLINYRDLKKMSSNQ